MSSEKIIQKALTWHYRKAAKYIVSNIYVFGWEMDLFMLRRNGYVCEFEIKITKYDFLADKKKVEKHNNLRSKIKGPNKFYYVCPTNMVTLKEVPDYAGLIYYNSYGRLDIIREAPFIHKIKLNLYMRLCDAFYYRFLNCKNGK